MNTPHDLCWWRWPAQVLGLVLGLLAAPWAQALEAPTGPVILSITGKLGAGNAPSGAQFDARMIDALPQHSYTTSTPWYPTPVTFTGPLLRDVLQAAKVSGATLQATALNDYRVEIPVSDALRYNMLLARQINGRPLSVRDKGPLFVIYPFDREPALKTSIYFSRSIWQLKSLHVE